MTAKLARAAERLGTTILAALGALHTALLASLLAAIWAVSTSAAQASPTVCNGQNLMDRMASDSPERHAAILESASATAFGDAILFEIAKPGVEPSYLFGTMHITDPRVVDLPPHAAAALDEAGTVAIEALGILDQEAMQADLLSRPDLTMFVDDTRLSDFMDEDQRAIIEGSLEERGMRLALVDRMKPWILSGMFALPDCETARQANGSVVLDVGIAERAKLNGSELVGLETVLEQLEAMASLPMQAHVDGLVDAMRMGDSVEDVIETMIVLYEDGQTGKIWPFIRAIGAEISPDRDSTNPTLSEQAFEEIMVNARNKTMFERSLPLLEAGNAFIAVGALHLPGEQGLAKMFADAGYTVTAVR